MRKSYRSKVAALLGNQQLAQQDREQGFGLDLGSAQRNYHLGRLAQDPEEKLDYLKQALWIDPHLADAYYERGLVHAALGNVELAIQEFSNAIVRDNQHAASYYQRALQYQLLGFPSQMITDLQRAVQVEPRFADAWLALSVEYEFQMLPTEAIHAAREAISQYEALEMNAEQAHSQHTILQGKYR